MSSLFNTVYASMLRRRELEEQKKLQLEDRDRQHQRETQQLLLDQAKMTDLAKQEEDRRHIKAAEVMARSAATLGETMPKGFKNPAVEEMAVGAYEEGRSLADTARREALLKQREQDMQLRGAQLGRLGQVESSKYARLTPQARESYLPQLADPSQPMPRAAGPLTERTPREELFSPHQGGAATKPASMGDYADKLLKGAANYKNMFGEGGPELNRFVAAAEFAAKLHVEGAALGVPLAQQLEKFNAAFPDIAGGKFAAFVNQSSQAQQSGADEDDLVNSIE